MSRRPRSQACEQAAAVYVTEGFVIGWDWETCKSADRSRELILYLHGQHAKDHGVRFGILFPTLWPSCPLHANPSGPLSAASLTLFSPYRCSRGVGTQLSATAVPERVHFTEF
jgi:hypothetical protein